MPFKNTTKAKEYARQWFQKNKIHLRKKNLINVKRYYQKIKNDPIKWKQFQKKRHHYHIKWYAKNSEIMKAKTKFYQNQSRFGGHRDNILKRDQYKCQICGSDKRILIHHKDGEGRGKQTPNNDITNLITLCYICHLSIHQYTRIKNMPLTKELLDKLP